MDTCGREWLRSTPRSTSSWATGLEVYTELRKQSESKEKAARIANASAARGSSNVGRKGGKSGSYDDGTVPELKKRAKQLGITSARPNDTPRLTQIRSIRHTVWNGGYQDLVEGFLRCGTLTTETS